MKKKELDASFFAYQGIFTLPGMECVTPNELDRVVRQIEERHMHYQLSSDKKKLIAQNAIKLSRSTALTIDDAIIECAIDDIHGENRLVIK